ncbi:CAP domain-containing protein [Alkalibacillus aidingensis]|uniref:CAP domain-containing protein n=1 Tax=Alkalibacillus aidingensis TaxID=2747607 RepID=UPI001CB7136F|nr:CAP domain-containing protein [Alkalibacillus aidingensis]
MKKFIVGLTTMMLMLTACQMDDEGANRQTGTEDNLQQIGFGGNQGDQGTGTTQDENVQFPYETDEGINYNIRGRENVNDWEPFDFNNRRSGEGRFDFKHAERDRQTQEGNGQQDQQQQDQQQQDQQQQDQQQPQQDQQQQDQQQQEAQQPGQQQDEQADVDVDMNVIEQVVELTNAEREQHGLSPLELDTQLTDVAQRKSVDMADNNYFSHQSPTYGSPFDMLDHYNVSYTAAAENIAAGQHSAEEVVQEWMNSEGHRENILNDSMTHIGVGYEDSGNMNPYWTQMFISK